MPIAYKIYGSHKLCYSVWTGNISPDEVLSFQRNMYQDSKWKPGFNEIVDVRNLVLESINMDDLFKLSKVAGDYTHGKNHPFKTAVVVDNLFIEGLAETYKALLSAPDTLEELKVFFQLKDAFDWLGIDQNTDISLPSN